MNETVILEDDRRVPRDKFYRARDLLKQGIMNYTQYQEATEFLELYDEKCIEHKLFIKKFQMYTGAKMRRVIDFFVKAYNHYSLVKFNKYREAIDLYEEYILMHIVEWAILDVMKTSYSDIESICIEKVDYQNQFFDKKLSEPMFGTQLKDKKFKDLESELELVEIMKNWDITKALNSMTNTQMED